VAKLRIKKQKKELIEFDQKEDNYLDLIDSLTEENCELRKKIDTEMYCQEGHTWKEEALSSHRLFLESTYIMIALLSFLSHFRCSNL
jgi:hypothetical protein